MSTIGQGEWSPPSIKNWSGQWKALAAAFVLLLDIGVSVGLALVALTTGAKIQGVATRFRGSSPEDINSGVAEEFGKPFFDMLLTTHNHVIPFSLIFLALGVLVGCTSLPKGRWKTFLMVDPFVSTFTTFGGLWLMRYLHEGFVWLVVLSSALLYGGLYLGSFFVLKDAFGKREDV